MKTALPEIKLTLHQRTALDHVRDTETFILVAYANNQLALDKPGEYARPLARVIVDRPYIYAGTVQAWRGEVLHHAERTALAQRVAGVWRSTDGEIYGDYWPEGVPA